MDYFNDLLESYSRLKKRTFKIEFINEQEGNAVDTTAEGALMGILNKAPEYNSEVGGTPEMQPIQDPQYPGLANFQYIKTRDGKGVNVKGVAGKGGEFTSKVVDNGAFSTKPGAKKMLEALYAAMRGEATEKTPEKSTSDAIEAQQQELQNRIGGTAEAYGVDIGTSPQYIEQSLKHIQEAQSRLGDPPPDDMDPRLAVLFSRPNAYLAGASKAGFEYKLVTATSIQVDEQGKKVGEGPMEPGLLEEAAEAHSFLTAFLGSNLTDDACDKLSERIGLYKGNVVLFNEGRTDGLVIKPNILQEYALQRASDKCVDDAGNPPNLDVSSDDISSQTKNAIKGTFYEAIAQFAGTLVAIQNMPEGPDRESLIKESVRSLAQLIQNKKTELMAIAASRDPERGMSLDDAYADQVIQEQLGLTSDDAALQQFITQEVKSILPVISFMSADNVRQVGTEVRTGGRADIEFVYSDEAKAREKALAIGSSVKRVPVTDGTGMVTGHEYVVGSGQKRLEAFTKMKLGELNTQERADQLLFEEVDERKDNNLEPGFYKAVDDIQGLSDSRKAAAQAYGRQLSEDNKRMEELLLKDSTYVVDGSITRVTPKQRLERMADVLKGKMTPDQLRSSAVGRAIYKEGADYKDFNDPRTRARAAEALCRQRRFDKLKKDLSAGNQAARDYVLRAAIIAGANAGDLGQVITDDAGRTVVMSHNEVFRLISNDPNTQFIVDGYSIKIIGGGVQIKYSQEGTWSGNSRNTRSLTTLPGQMIGHPKLVKPLPKNESQEDNVLLAFLIGQQRLLESIIKRTKTNDLL